MRAVRVIVEYQAMADGKENIKLILMGKYATLRSISNNPAWSSIKEKRFVRAFFYGDSSLIVTCGDKCTKHKNYKILTAYVLKDIQHTVEFREIRVPIRSTGNAQVSSQSPIAMVVHEQQDLPLPEAIALPKPIDPEEELLILYKIYKHAEIILTEHAVLCMLYTPLGLTAKTTQLFNTIADFICQQLQTCGYNFIRMSELEYKTDKQCLYAKIQAAETGSLALIKEKLAPQLQYKIRHSLLKSPPTLVLRQ